MASSHLSSETTRELQQYLQAYMTLEPILTQGVLCTMLGLYLRYPLLVFALGFLALGVVMIPVVTGVFGFFLSFSVCSMVASFGDGGLWIALALFGLRCAVTMVCHLALAVGGMEAALRRFHGLGGYYQRDWLRLGFCLGCLLLGIYVDYLLSPRLLAWALEFWL